SRSSLFLFFFLHYHGPPRDLPSFPTRRSSDLGSALPAVSARAACITHFGRARGRTGTGASVRRQETPTHAAAAPDHGRDPTRRRSEEHTSELQSRFDLVCRLLLEKKKKKKQKK